MVSTPAPTVAVIGAGIAGLACASRLAAAGMTPVVFDKSRGLGGRIATRRGPDGLTFDHGAQFATARGPAFSAYMRGAVAGGAAAGWDLPDGASGDRRYVGTPGMSSLVRPLAEGLEIRGQHTLTKIERTQDGWQLAFAETGQTMVADRVALCVPAPQASALLSAFPQAVSALSRVDVAPCWAVMIALDDVPAPGALPDTGQIADSPIAWIAPEASKPYRVAEPARLVLHASPEWSRDNLERPAEEVARLLLDALNSLSKGSLPATTHVAAHRWRYAKTQVPLGRPFLDIADGTLLAGGDWCLGARVECGFDSGVSLADRILHDIG
ncbi:FAD-dependent oxidoreductase [Stappia stellulata]|uniref:NAD(P)/FAD-dependent oxidoreductase n=1 Tax=Stappia stellulata TaxID=71235 RepID=UPI001CD2BF5E|nr:FAD-dependent oxidoreductase [Stappia stellulata]MCA1243530.1 FAD-dependent oxidoreductase [Stappia stellulata]